VNKKATCPRVLCIALDGATYKMIDPALKKGLLPNLQDMIAAGTSGDLESTIPPISTYAWPTFYTGVNSGKSGVFALESVCRAGGSSRLETEPVNFSKVQEKSLWKILSDDNKSAGVVNIPVTYPVEQLNGFIVSGFLTPSAATDYFYPAAIKDDLIDYEIDIKFGGKLGVIPDSGVDKHKVLEQQYEVSRTRHETCCKLIRKYQPDFFIVNFKGVDVVQHLFWDKEQLVFEFLKKIDSYLGQICKVMKADVNIVFSDHGFHSRSEKYFHINSWLRDNGYLTPSSGLESKAGSLIYSYGLKLSQLFPFIRKLVPEKIKVKIMSEENVFKQLDWNKTKAFGSRWGVYMNKAAFASQHELAETKNEIQNALSETLDNGMSKKVFQKIETKDDLFEGPYTDSLPDMVLLPDSDYKINPNLHQQIITPRKEVPDKVGDHNADTGGILVVSGTGINKGVRINGAKLIDLAPTILHIMESKIPRIMDGELLGGLFSCDSPFRAREPVFEEKRIESKKVIYEFSAEEKLDVEQKLKGLGYLD
jgi:predicted AlkP superfamily phosphohydrolase/phosphomutase